MDYSLPARLMLAHLLGDFVLQPDSWVRDRNLRHFGSRYLYLHGLIHFTLAALLTFSRDGWWIGMVIALAHIVFDGLKALWKLHDLRGFIIDQICHVIIIVYCWCLAQHICPGCELYNAIHSSQPWWIATGYLLNIALYPRLIALATEKWRAHVPPEREILYKAGRWIGIIERMLAFTFVLLGQYPALGFLLAAKSIFRFGDLRESKDKGHTEYVLIGTLLSFGLAIFTGIIVKAVITGNFIPS